MDNITKALYRVNGKYNETKCIWVKSMLRQRQFKSHVCRRLRNDRSDGASLTAGGRLFQALAAATGNAQSPSVERFVGLTTRVGQRTDDDGGILCCSSLRSVALTLVVS